MGFGKSPWRLLPLIGALLGILAALLLLRSRSTAPRPALTAPEPVSAAPTAPPSPDLTAAVPAETPPGQAEESPLPSPVPTVPPEELSRLFAAFVEEQPGRWSLCFASLPEGEPVFCLSDREPMVSASLIKLFIMGAVCERLESGTLERDAVYPALHAMITVSDNASANSLIRLLGDGDAQTGMEAVNDWCRRQGYAETRLNRLMLAENGLQNYTGAADCAAFLAAVYRGECVSEEASREMLSLLLEQTVNDRLPEKLPAGTPVAHKTGDLSGLCCADVGIVYSPGGAYILCVLCNDQPYDAAAGDAIAALSAQVYALLNPQT